MSLQPVSRFCCNYRTTLAAFAAGLLVGSLVHEFARPVFAHIPNAGQQRLELNQQMDDVNA